ncbi:MAG: pilus assembly protein PilM [Coriobacteriales bacterium]|nr:pilus assembly protein PilM [Coriobacteriales bacterium]
MAASYVGVDIGTGSVKMAYREGGAVKLVSRALPENIVGEDGVVAPETLASLMAELRKEEKVGPKNVVLVLSDNNTFFRHVTLPPMSESELKLNLPYEFRDYIDEDPGTYVYDYAVDEIPMSEEGNPERLELYAAAVSRKLLDSRSTLLRKAGFRLKVAIPPQMAYARLLLGYLERNPIEDGLHQVFIDIGYERVSVHLYHGFKFKASKTIDFGCRDLDMTIADLKHVDRHVASTYKQTNFEGVLDSPECEAVYDQLCFEINKVINFYNFSNAEDVERIYLLGGGVEIPQLLQVVINSFPIPLETAVMVMPPDIQQLEQVGSYALAIAGLLEGEAI